MTPHTRYAEIIKCLRAYTRPLTAREVKRDLGYEDMNCVRPRLSEGVHITKEIIEVGTKLEASGPHQKEKPVTLYALSGPRETRPMFKGLS